MPLSQQRRQQLDGIVQQLDQQNSSTADIQAVVSDFQNKYGNEQKKVSPLQQASDISNQFNQGLLSGAGRDILGLVQGVLPSKGKQAISKFEETALPMTQPATQAGQIAKTTGRVTKGLVETGTAGLLPGSAVVSGATAGGASALSSAGQQQLSGTETAKSVVKGSAWGAGLSFLQEKAAGGLTNIAKGIYNHFLGTTVGDEQAGKDVAQWMIDNNINGSARNISSKLDAIQKEHGPKIGQVVQDNANKTINVSDTVKELKQYAQQLSDGGATQEQINQVYDLAQKLDFASRESGSIGKQGEISVQRAQQLKQTYDNLINSFTDPNPGIQQARKTARDSLNQKLGNLLGEEYTIPNMQWSNAATAKQALSSTKIQKVSPIRIGADLVAMASGRLGTVLGAGDIALRQAEKPAVSTRGASALSLLGRSPALRNLLEKAAVLQAGKSQAKQQNQ